MKNTKVTVAVDKLEAYLRMKASDGKIFGVTFQKKDGSIRDMVCRLGVTKGVTGEGLKFDPLAKRLMVVFDMQKYAFRMINLQTVQQVRIDNEILQVA